MRKTLLVDKEKVRKGVRMVLEGLGYDLQDPEIVDTPDRVANFLCNEFHEAELPDIKIFPNTEYYDEIIAVTDIPVYSLCAHHMIPFFGKAHVAYIPESSYVGLSKIARIVQHYSKQLQTQERLTKKIAGVLMELLKPKGVMVIIEARHLCMEMRGVRIHDTVTITSDVRGVFRNPPEGLNPREEFLNILKTKR